MHWTTALLLIVTIIGFTVVTMIDNQIEFDHAQFEQEMRDNAWNR